jgi:hypothetical protein
VPVAQAFAFPVPEGLKIAEFTINVANKNTSINNLATLLINSYAMHAFSNSFSFTLFLEFISEFWKTLYSIIFNIDIWLKQSSVENS